MRRLTFKRWLGERHENDAIAVDTETTGLNPYDRGAAVRLIQIGDTQQGWSIPWLDWRGLALEALNQYDGTLITHNGAFEMKWVHEHSPYRFPRARTVDTMIGAHIINPLGSGALKQLSTKYVDPKAGAGQNILNEAFAENGWDWATVPVTFDPYWTYAALDTVLTAQLWDVFKPQLTGAGPYKDVFDLEMAVRFIVSDMERRGARIDLDYSQEWFDKLNDDADMVSRWCKDAFGISITSNAQLGRKLIDLGGELFDFTANRSAEGGQVHPPHPVRPGQRLPGQRAGARRAGAARPAEQQVRIGLLLQLPVQERARVRPRRHPHARGAHWSHVRGQPGIATDSKGQRTGPQCVHPARGQHAGHHRLLPDRDAAHGRGESRTPA